MVASGVLITALVVRRGAGRRAGRLSTWPLPTRSAAAGRRAAGGGGVLRRHRRRRRRVRAQRRGRRPHRASPPSSPLQFISGVFQPVPDGSFLDRVAPLFPVQHLYRGRPRGLGSAWGPPASSWRCGAWPAGWCAVRTFLVGACVGSVVPAPVRLRIFTEPQQGASYDQLLAVALPRRGARLRRLLPVRPLPEDGCDAPEKAARADRTPGSPWPAWPGTTIQRSGWARWSTAAHLPPPRAAGHRRWRRSTPCPAGGWSWASGPGGTRTSTPPTACPFPALGERFERLEDQLAIITGLWTTPVGSTFSYDGRWISVPDSPRAAQAGAVAPPADHRGRVGPERTPRLAATYADEFNHAVPRGGVGAGAGTGCWPRASTIGRRPVDDALLGGPGGVRRPADRARSSAARRHRPEAGRRDALRRRRHRGPGPGEARPPWPPKAWRPSTSRSSTSTDLDHLEDPGRPPLTHNWQLCAATGSRRAASSACLAASCRRDCN